MTLSFDIAGASDAEEIAALRSAVAKDLTARFGEGAWSMNVTDRGVLWHMRQGEVMAARVPEGVGGRIVGTLALAKRKPWAINPAYFTKVRRPVHLSSMAVLPGRQGMGVGRRLMAAAEARAGELDFEAIRLDAYQGEAGAGPFYRKCGYEERGRVTYRDAALIYFERLI